jgi:hypothetical protein
VRCPVLSVLGTDTLPLFADGRRLLHDWFPWCQDADIDGGDHMLPIEYPTQPPRRSHPSSRAPTGSDRPLNRAAGGRSRRTATRQSKIRSTASLVRV